VEVINSHRSLGLLGLGHCHKGIQLTVFVLFFRTFSMLSYWT